MSLTLTGEWKATPPASPIRFLFQKRSFASSGHSATMITRLLDITSGRSNLQLSCCDVTFRGNKIPNQLLYGGTLPILLILRVVPCQLTLAAKDLYVSRHDPNAAILFNSAIPAAVAKLSRRGVLCLLLALEPSTLPSRHNVSSPPLTMCPTYDNCLFRMFLRRRCSPTTSSTLSLLIFLVHDTRNSLLQHYISKASGCASVLFVLSTRICTVRPSITSNESLLWVDWQVLVREQVPFFLWMLLVIAVFLISRSYLQSVANVLPRYSKHAFCYIFWLSSLLTHRGTFFSFFVLVEG